jgi:hypothetical protein
MKQKFWLIWLLTAFVCKANAQQIPLDMLVQSRLNELEMRADTNLFSGFRSINWLEVKPYLQHLKTDMADSVFDISLTTGNSWLRHITNDNWVQLNGPRNKLSIDPYVLANAGIESEYNKPLFKMAAGIRLQGVYEDKLSYNVSYAYNSMRLPLYVNNNIAGNGLYIPGMGKATPGANGIYSVGRFNGNLTYLAGKHVVLSAGYGKNFIGDGYRSLLLSDNASDNPYIRLQARLWKVTYNVLYNRYQNPRFQIDGTTQGKYSVMHYLGINISKRLQIGMFDNVIWYAKDTNVHRGVDFQYLNPLIFLRPLEFEIGSPDNAFLGLTFKYRLLQNSYCYAQLGLDDINIAESFKNNTQHLNNKYGIQLGMFNSNFLQVKNLSYRIEWNAVRPYMYDYRSNKIGLNYTHNNQSLANPFNANFHEFISMLQYHNNRWYGYLQNLLTIRGENPGLLYNNGEDLWGGEDDVPLLGSKTLQGNRHTYFFNQLSVGYLLNPRNRLCLQADMVYRKHTAPGIATKDVFINIGITTRLFNYNNDF